jgi:erythromycin esterase
MTTIRISRLTHQFQHKPNRKLALSLSFFCCLLITGCGGGDSAASLPVTPVTPPAINLNSAQQFVSQQAVALQSLTQDQDFSELKPIADAIGKARIVQLGESSHGSGSMNQLKTRLIKYLHQHHGFNLIAFESSMFACNQGLEPQAAVAADVLMYSCIFGVWHTEEVLELFRYIKQTQNTDRPVRLAGFDPQLSGIENESTMRSFYQQALASLTASQRTDIINLALDVLSLQKDGVSCFRNDAAACARVKAQHADLKTRLSQAAAMLDGLTSAQGQLAYLLMISNQHAIDSQLNEANKNGRWIEARDLGMAANITGLLQRRYPQEKMLVWAHNAHIAEDFPWERLRSGNEKVMGMHLHQQWQDELFTIGLFMLTGQQADNNRNVTAVTPHQATSLEGLFMHLNHPVSFMRLPKTDQPGEGDDWLHQLYVYKDWGAQEQRAYLARSFDAVLVIRNNTAPRYLSGQ